MAGFFDTFARPRSAGTSPYWTKAEASPSSPWYIPGGGYGGRQDDRTTPVVGQYDKQNPDAVYEAFLAERGLAGYDRKAQFARGLQPRLQTGYKAALRENMDLTWNRYLRGQTKRGLIDDLYAGLTPDQRGENESLYAPRTRVIRAG